MVLACGCGRERGEPAETDSLPGLAATTELDPERLDWIVAHFNSGVAAMEQFRPGEAAEAFDEVVTLAPSWPRGRLNLAIALLNIGSHESIARAEQELARVLDIAPRDPHAHFTLGMLYRHQGRLDEAKRAFAQVLAAAPEDPETHYQLGVLLAADEPATARLHLEKTLEKLPHHESACYQLQALLRRTGDLEGARRILERFEALKASGAGVASGMKYGEMGRYAEVLRRFGDPYTPAAAAAAVPAYSEVAAQLGLVDAARGPASWPEEAFEPGSKAADSPLAAVLGPGLAVADVDGDGDLDLYAPGLGGGGALYLNEAGRFTVARNSGIDGSGAVAGWFGDYDGDGDVDLYLTRHGPNRLYRNDGAARFDDVTSATGTAGQAELSLGAAWADADHDGDLDLYVCNAAAQKPGPSPSGETPAARRRGGNSLFRNNGDGTFTDVAREAGIDGGGARSAAVAFLDVDDDHDLDLCLLRLDAPNQLFLNDRVGRYREATASVPDFARAGPGWGAVSGDMDADGREDLLVLRGKELPVLLRRTPSLGFAADTVFESLVRPIGGAVGALVGDLDLDADPDIVLLDAGRESVAHLALLNQGGGRFAAPVRFGEMHAAPRARGAVAADLDADGMLELVVARVDSPPEVWKAPLSPGRHWLEVLPLGQGPSPARPRHDPEVGLRIEVQAGREPQVASVVASAGYLGSPPSRVHFGLGAHAKADYVRLTWPDAVLQSEIEVPADAAWSVRKVQRKPSSCPLLFSWDGERFAFVTDFLGVGGVGFFISPGQYAPPDPDEDVRIPPECIRPRAGRYLLRIAEPLEEVTYLDELHLVAYDHPAELEIHPDERFGGSPPLPTGRPWACAAKIFPAAARDARGRDVLERLLEIDRRYVEPPLDLRFAGYADEHWLELDFGDQLARAARRAPLVLCLHGWVEYTYSHVNYAAHQAGLAFRPPCLEVPDGAGGWRVVLPEVGFPAGLPRTMTLDLARLPGGPPSRFRLRTNMEVFWDQVFVAEVAVQPELRAHVLQPSVAALRFLGFPREYSPDGADPTLYDYQRIDLGVPFKNLSGNFTRYGDVRELLVRVDDRFVVMARGEEIALEFDATRLPALPSGWRRTLVLHADGYCKDMDLYTAFPHTVEPLPYHSMGTYPPAGWRAAAPGVAPPARAAWERLWNTRRVAGNQAAVAVR